MTRSEIRGGMFLFVIAATFALPAVGTSSGQAEPPAAEPTEKEKKPFDAKAADKEIREIANKIAHLKEDVKKKVTPGKPFMAPPPQQPIMPQAPVKPAANADKRLVDGYQRAFDQYQRELQQFRQDQITYPKRVEEYNRLAKLFPEALKKWEDQEKQRIAGINQENESLLKKRKEIEAEKKEAKKPDKATTGN